MQLGGGQAHAAQALLDSSVRHKLRNVEKLDMKAIWKGSVIAQSDETLVIEGNHYFPAESARTEFLKDSDTKSVCPWKGTASYYNINVDGETNPDAAWYYPDPKDAASEIRGRIAFWKGVQVIE